MLSRAPKKRFSGGRLPPKPTRRYSVSGGMMVTMVVIVTGTPRILGHAMPIIRMRVAIPRAPQALTIA